MVTVLDAVATGRWFDDPRQPGRRLRITRHPADGTVVVSIWRDHTCTATFRLTPDDAAALMEALA